MVFGITYCLPPSSIEEGGRQFVLQPQQQQQHHIKAADIFCNVICNVMCTLPSSVQSALCYHNKHESECRRTGTADSYVNADRPTITEPREPRRAEQRERVTINHCENC